MSGPLCWWLVGLSVVEEAEFEKFVESFDVHFEWPTHYAALGSASEQHQIAPPWVSAAPPLAD